MDQPPSDPLLYILMLAGPIGSLVVWLGILARWQKGRPLLEYEARSPVPWRAPVAMVTVVFVAVSLLTAGGVDDPQPMASPFELAQRLMGLIFFECILIGCIMLIVSVLYEPSLRDLGLPIYGEELARDIRLGAIAFLAAVGPVYIVQMIMVQVFGPSNHFLFEMMTGGEPNLGVFFLAAVAAAIVAPVSEEILFRLLFQGWLEAREDERVRISPTGAPDEHTIQAFDSSLEDSTQPLLTTGPAQQGMFGLPHGWAPILISSLLFGVAHSGYGPDPIAVTLLALVLGYVYQRTHRIVPCIVAHALFNSLAMLILWRIVVLSGK